MRLCLLIVCLIAIFPYATVAEDEKLATVVSEGIGTDVKSAIQRAAEAALTQVVGSFMDVDKIINKRKEIRNGIRTKTKSITAKTREYSQGSIQKVEILDKEKDGDFIRVSAKFIVRIEKFKTYIEKIVTAEKVVRKVFRTGLLAKLKTKKRQAENLYNLTKEKVVEPILKGGVIIPEIVGEIQEVTNSKILNLFESNNIKLKDDDLVIDYHVKFHLNENFIENITNVLDHTAERKYRGFDRLSNNCGKRMDQIAHGRGKCGNYSLLIAVGSAFGKQNYKFPTIASFGHFIVFSGKSAHEEPVYYFFPGRHKHLCMKLHDYIMGTIVGRDMLRRVGDRGWNNLFHPRQINIKFLDANKNVLRHEIIKQNRSKHSIVLRRKGHFPTKGAYRYSRVNDVVKLLNISNILGNSTGRCTLQIAKSTTFTVVTKVSENLLSHTESILLSAAPNRN